MASADHTHSRRHNRARESDSGQSVRQAVDSRPSRLGLRPENPLRGCHLVRLPNQFHLPYQFRHLSQTILTLCVAITFRVDVRGFMGLRIPRYLFFGAFPKILLQEAHHLEVSDKDNLQRPPRLSLASWLAVADWLIHSL